VSHTPDLDAVRAYVQGRLAELAPHLRYHRAAHTIDDVVPNALRLARAEGVEGRDLAVIEAAAWFHDVGFIERAAGHEQVGIALAQRVLPAMGFTGDDLAEIAGAVLATRVPQVPTSRLGAILADADLDVLGRDDFFERNAALRDELDAEGRSFTDRAWFVDQANFLASHRYFTVTARHGRDRRKLAHATVLRRLADAADTAATAGEDAVSPSPSRP
jgi:uncharacterized protein